MSDLLTHAEYQAIASDLDFPRASFVDGKCKAGKGARTVGVEARSQLGTTVSW